MILLYRLFCRLFVFILYAVDTSVEMCLNFIGPDESVWFQENTNKNNTKEEA